MDLDGVYLQFRSLALLPCLTHDLAAQWPPQKQIEGPASEKNTSVWLFLLASSKVSEVVVGGGLSEATRGLRQDRRWGGGGVVDSFFCFWARPNIGHPNGLRVYHK